MKRWHCAAIFGKIDEKKEQQEIIQIMNILFFLTPKEDVAHVDEDDTMRQVLEKMEHHGYTAIPLLSREGKYIGTITEGDLLLVLKDRNFPDLKLLEDMPITSIQRRRDNEAVKIDESMEDLFGKVMNQNFVPVVDDKRVFIGIVTRKDILAYLGKKAAAQENGVQGHGSGIVMDRTKEFLKFVIFSQNRMVIRYNMKER